MYDLLLKGGYVIDPANAVDGPRDVAISGGRIACVAEDVPGHPAIRTVDVAGLYMTPGLVDIHVHHFVGGGRWGVSPDDHSFPSGVTTAVDAGSAGWRNFERFRRQFNYCQAAADWRSLGPSY